MSIMPWAVRLTPAPVNICMWRSVCLQRVRQTGRMYFYGSNDAVKQSHKQSPRRHLETM